MNRAELKQLIFEIVSRKLKNNNSVYGNSARLNELNSPSTIKQTTAQKNLDAAKKKQEDALKKKRALDKRKADFERRNYPTVNKNQRLSMKADIDVGKASTQVADAEAELAKKEEGL